MGRCLKEDRRGGACLSFSPPPTLFEGRFSFCILLEEFVVGHAKGREEASIFLKINLIVVILVQAFHQLVDPTVLHFLQHGRKGSGFEIRRNIYPSDYGRAMSSGILLSGFYLLQGIRAEIPRA